MMDLSILAGAPTLQLCTLIMATPQESCQLAGILLQKPCHCGNGAVVKQLNMLHPLIYQGWAPPDHMCLIIHLAAIW